MAIVVNVIPESSVDFPDAAQRFNWCSCQPAAHRGMAGLGANGTTLPDLPIDPARQAILDASALGPAPAAAFTAAAPHSMFDFGFWDRWLGAPAPVPDAMPVSSVERYLPWVAVAALAGVMLYTSGGKRK